MSLTTRTDVTAIKFFKNHILAGIGSYVNIYDRVTTKLLRRIHTFNAQKIHGFVISNCGKKVLVFGGKQFTVLAIKAEEEVIISRCFDPVLCDDWLHSAVWSDDDVIILLSAHNVVQRWKTSDQTLLSQQPSEDVSILYSGLLLPVQNELIVLAGTVYSEVILHQCGGKVLHRLEGHRGVIFSICCDPEKGIIVSTSDDRSVRIWTIKSPGYDHNTLAFWEHSQIECSHEVYGHAARVMRSFITKEFVVSGGEDAAICYWRLDGLFVRKVVTHQTSTIWAMDADDEFLVTGGGDSGIILHPLTVASDYCRKELLDIDGTVKRIQFTARKNIVLINDADELIYYDVKSKLQMAHKLFHQSTYRLLTLSSCKQLVCAADMSGNINIYVENCKDAACLLPLIDTKIEVDQLMSVHWAGNRHLVLCSHEGIITVLVYTGKDVQIYFRFLLPPCREKYLTAATINPNNNMIIVGDRCGNVHCYLRGQELPVKTFKRAQGTYGPTSINYRNNEIITTGRVGNIAYHHLKENISESKYKTEKNLEFQWVEKFLDRNLNLVCGFHDKNFVIVDCRKNTKIFEVHCGGGHRPWDAVRLFEEVNNKVEESIKLTYFKNTNVYLITAQLSKIVSRTIVNGSQSKIINCLKTYKTDLDKSITYYISGGEDTTLRVSSVNSQFEFQDEFIYKHLSNIRSLKIFPSKDKVLVMSVGGRAQLCINLFSFEVCDGNVKVTCQELVDFMVKGDDEKRKRLRSWRDPEPDFDPETRMMDVDAIQFNEHLYLIFVGCSDMLLRVYTFDKSKKDMQFRQVKEIEYHEKCILKTLHIPFEDLDIIITATTRGEMVFWSVTSKINEFSILPFKNSIHLHNSGINSFDYKILGSKILIAVGGDDNAITLLLLTIESDSSNKSLSLNIVDRKTIETWYCSQVSGLVLLDDMMISTSIDQRVTVCRWGVEGDNITCGFVKQVYSDVSDVAGLNLLEHNSESATVCVYGKGFEVLKIDLTEPETK